MKPNGILPGPLRSVPHTGNPFYPTGGEFGSARVPRCPIAHTLLFEILCSADKSSGGSSHLSVFHERDVHFPPLLSEFIVFVTNPEMGSSCNTRHLIVLSTPRGLFNKIPQTVIVLSIGDKQAKIDSATQNGANVFNIKPTYVLYIKHYRGSYDPKLFQTFIFFI